MRKYLWAFLPLFWGACAPLATDESQSTALDFKEEMLFEGPNSFTANNPLALSQIAENLAVDPSQVKKVKAGEVLVKFSPEYAGLVESLLLQVTSDEKELVTVASLSPVDSEGNYFTMNLAAEVELQDYLADSSTVWVLDANLINGVDQMQIVVGLTLLCEYSE